MKRFLASFFTAIALSFAVLGPAVLTGCTGPNAILAPVPDGPNAKIAVALSSVTTARELLTTAVNANQITATDAENLRQQLNTARQGIDVAQTVFKTDLTGGEARLAAARLAIDGVRAYLIAKGAKP